MRDLISRVKRLQRLAALESAARLGSFTAAAEELHVTQPAVTRQVRALESELGVALFRRSANRAILSDAGHRLHRAVDQAFAGIESELKRIGHEQSVFVLAANPGVAQRWLVPYLSGLKAAAGDAEVRLWLFDRNAELARGTFDAAIHAGEGKWPDLQCKLLFPEIVVPVSTPEHAAHHGLTHQTQPSALLDATLLHLDDEDRPWMSWATWFGHFGLDLPERSRQVIYNNYALVLQAAIAGNGVALAWRYLIDDLLDHGTVVTVGAGGTASDIRLLFDLAPLRASGHRPSPGGLAGGTHPGSIHRARRSMTLSSNPECGSTGQSCLPGRLIRLLSRGCDTMIQRGQG